MKLKNKNFVEKIINYLLNVLIFIFAIILLISIYMGVQTRVLGNDYTDFFGYSIFEVQTGSMADTINAGDWVVVKLTQNAKLNDVVTYKLNKEFVTHRVIEVYNGTYITKGDANNAKDEPIDQKQIVGKVVSVWTSFGIVRKTLFNPTVLIALIVTLFLFDYVIKKNKAENTKTRKSVKTKNIDLFISNAIKYAGLFVKFILEKAASILKKIKGYRSNKKVAQNYNMPKNENKDLGHNEKIPVLNNAKDIASKVEPEEYYTDTDELDKTSFYRVVPVDSNDVGDKFKNAPTKAEVEEYYKDTDELDKTSFFRMIPVDASEVDDTLLEIAENEIKDSGKNDKEKDDVVESKQEVEEKIEEDAGLTDINLELLQSIKSNRKSKNIIETVMFIKKEELNELINILVKDNKAYVNKATVKDMFMTTYTDARYYNCFGDNSSESLGKKTIAKIEKAIKEVALASELINHGNDTKYSDIVDIYADTFILIANLEQARDSITDSKAKNEFYKKEIKKYAKDWDKHKVDSIIDEITKVQKNYNNTLEYFLKRLETNMFNLNFNKLVTKKDMYGLDLQHNITFSKVYSDYIIDKTYTEGIIAEDKMKVLLTLLSVQLIKDMILTDFDRKYILHIPNSLYTKEKKLIGLLDMIDDKYAKDNVIILITFEDLVGNIHCVKEMRKMSYKFALIFDKEVLIKDKDRGNIYMADYIFINKKAVNIENIIPFIPEELLDKIIYEDIVDKVGDFGDDE